MLWYFYTLIGLVLLWMWDYTKKLMLAKWGDKEAFLFMSFVFYIIAFFVNFLFFGDISLIDWATIRSAFIMGFFDFLWPVGLLAALKYLDSSLAFISIRFTGSFLILLIGISVLWDRLSLINYIGFCIGLIAIFLLSGLNLKKKIMLNKKGVLGVLITIFAVVGSNSYFKYIVPKIHVDNFMFFKFSFTFLFIILYIALRKKFTLLNKENISLVIPYAFFNMLFFVGYFLHILPSIYLLWPISLSYKILSFSIIVPITLSILFLWEKITKVKIFAFIFTIFSLICFIP